MVALPPPKFLAPSRSHSPELNSTGFYVVMSVLTASYASEAIRRYGIRGYPGAWRVGVVSFCVGSWLGIYRAGAPLVDSKHGAVADPE